MTVNEWLREATNLLGAGGISTSRLDALVLLEYCLVKDRAWLLAHPEFEISSSQIAKLEKLLSRRVQHEPLAYIRGKTEFYGREFVLTPAVLEPRPESETMISLLKELPPGHRPKQGLENPSNKLRLADVGTGSGALGITAQLELPNIEVDLLEIDKKALEVAKINVDKFTLPAQTIHSDLLAGSAGDYHILLCNLPYVPDDYSINQAATHEPRIAIFGGPDGLDAYRRLFKQISNLSHKPLYILTESLPPQHATLAQIASTGGYHIHQTDDFIQVFQPRK